MTIQIVGLGPAGPDLTPTGVVELLRAAPNVVARTRRHPAAVLLEDLPDVIWCDDLYDTHESFDDVYAAIVERVVEAASSGDVVYAVPGSPFVGERTVGMLRARSDLAVQIHPAPSYLDAMLTVIEVDPLFDGLKVLDGHDLPRPLVFDVPTVIGHVVLPEQLADVLATIDRAVPEALEIAVVVDAGSSGASVTWGAPSELDPELASIRTSLFVPSTSGGLTGVVQVMERLRAECPWDREQSHESLSRYLGEESAELADAVAQLDGDDDWVGLAAVEEELGDVLLQVLFHAEIARTNGAFDIVDVAEGLRRKLVRRHPHVFGDVDAVDPDAVRANWERIKAAEKPTGDATSVMDGIPRAMGALSAAAEIGRRAARLGFDWPAAEPVIDGLADEVAELRGAIGSADEEHELGDVLFAAVNVARHLDVDADLALRRANARFVERFRVMESAGPLAGESPEALDDRWERAKRWLASPDRAEGGR